MLRSFQLRTGAIGLTALARAALAVERGDNGPAERLVRETEALVGPVRRAKVLAQEGRLEAD